MTTTTHIETFTANDWETPDWLAQLMADQVKPTDHIIVEPSAGTGQIVRCIEAVTGRIIHANEINPSRYEIGRRQVPHCYWWQCDYLARPNFHLIDLVVANPPFEFAMQFISTALNSLNPDYPHARLLFLLPIDFFSSQKRCDQFENLDCRIYQRLRIRGRVGYIRNGEVISGRQIYDCLYDIRPGKIGPAMAEIVLNP